MMYDGLDYLLAPVTAGMCKYESLIDGKLDLLDIAIMNDALRAKNENEHRAQQAAKTQGS